MSQHVRKRVLFVAYQFPPAGGIGVHRVVKFVKHLPEFGWDSSVLTVANPSVPLTDDSLNQDIPDSTAIVRAKTWEPSYRWKQSVSASSEQKHRSSRFGWMKRGARNVANLVFQPDLQILWAPQAIRAGKKLLAQQPHDLIIATAPPFSSFYVGEQLSKQSGLPLVLDYRDEWGISNNYWENKQPGWFSTQIQTRMQSRLLRHATAAIATTPSSCRSVKQSAEDAHADTICEYIYNGFDPDDFRKSGSNPPVRQDYGNGVDKFRLSYVGTLWNLNSVEPIVKALQKLSHSAPRLLERLEFVVAGRRTADQEQWLDQLDDLNCSCVRLPFISHDQAVSLMQTSDCLTLLNSKLPGAERIVNGKIFEYLAAEKPFLLISPPGDMWELTNDCPYAMASDPDDVPTIAAQLAQELESQRMTVQRQPGLWNSRQHERRYRAEQLADLMDRIISPEKTLTERPKDRIAGAAELLS